MKKIDFNTAIKALEDGKKVLIGEILETWIDEKGVVWQKNINDNRFFYNAELCGDDVFQIEEEPKPFEITETGLYKTRDGRKAFVNYVENEKAIGVVENTTGTHFWELNAKHTSTIDTFDIIGKWGDDV